MGSKSQTSTTNQQQSYAPTGAGYITNALNQAGNAAQLPFNIPQAPVAGFNQDQQTAFQNVNNAQGMAQPYINQAQQYFSPQGTQQFLNPYASNVMANLQDVFGQQASQNTGQLTQAAGGVGADRIGVGQSELAKQQGLVAGQTMSGLYNNAVQQAQSAGYGTAALGSQAQNAALQGAQAQLGTGGLQQQLSQAQMNSPYQQQLAQAAFPYQQAQFLAGITGSLAPGLGGTTTGQGTTTSPGPSVFSQLLGLGTAGVGAAGGLGAFGGGSGGKGYQNSTGNYNGMTNEQQDYLQDSGFSLPSARGGAIHPYAEGGAAGDEPIDASHGVVPNEKLTTIQPHIPQLNLNPPQQSGGGGGGGLGDVIGAGMKIAGMFLKRGGGVNPYASGGAATDEEMERAKHYMRGLHTLGLGTWSGKTAEDQAAQQTQDMADDIRRQRPPVSYASGGDTPSPLDEAQWPYGPEGGPSSLDAAQWPSGPIGGPSDVVNFGDPIREPDQAAVNDWRQSADADRAAGNTAQAPTRALALAQSAGAPAFPPPPGVHGRSGSQPLPDAGTDAGAGATGASEAGAGDPEAPPKGGFAASPWAALMAAGLGMAAGTSPFAGVNIGQGGLQGLKTLEAQRAAGQKDETIAQSAKRLELEAKHHEDQYTRATPYQQFEMHKPIPIGQHIEPITGQTLTTYGLMQPNGTIKPIDPTAAPANPAQAATDDATLPANAKATQGFLIPGKNVPENVDPSVLAAQDPGVANMVRAIDEGRAKLTDVPMKQRFMVERLLHAYDGKWDETVWGARSRQQNDLTTNGNAGKMIMSVNQLLPHLSTLSDRAAALNATAYPEANTFKNWWATATGDSRVKRFNSVRDVAATDAARLLRGTGAMTESEINHWRDNFANAGSPSQLQDVIRDLSDDLIGARMSSIKESYRINMRQEPPEFLSQEARGALAKIKGGAAPAQAAGAQPAQGPAPATGAAPAAAQPPMAGAKQAPDGHWYVNQNGKYFRVDQ
jgi:hypothetical protein